jgi:hypothetical protein
MPGMRTSVHIFLKDKLFLKRSNIWFWEGVTWMTFHSGLKRIGHSVCCEANSFSANIVNNWHDPWVKDRPTARPLPWQDVDTRHNEEGNIVVPARRAVLAVHTHFSILSTRAMWPVTVAEWSRAWPVLARLDAGIVGSNPTRGMDVYLYV